MKKEITNRPKGFRTWIEVDTIAIDHNIATARRLTAGNTTAGNSMASIIPIMAVVKSNAYGHGLFDFSKYVVSKGVEWLGVDSVVEALHLRKEGIQVPILVLGYTLPEYLSDAVANDISLTISSMRALRECARIGAASGEKNPAPLNIHIKIDTGLHRQGFLPDEVPALLGELFKMKGQVEIQGLYTHLADAKSTEGIEFSRDQQKIFGDVCEKFHRENYRPLVHIKASPGLIRFGVKKKEDGNDELVRLGALLYGLWPSPAMEKEFSAKISLSPALSWKTLITETKRLPKGSPIGYNRSEILSRDSLVAVCPVGYWHGFPSAGSPRPIVLVRGKGAKVLGTVSMDMIVIDCTDIADVEPLDIVTIISSDPSSPVSASNVAARAGLSVHQLLTCLNSRIERVYR